jgi:hypothetical protein
MTRGLIMFVALALALASSARAEEVEVAYAAIPADAMKSVWRIEVGPTNGGEVVRAAWVKPVAQIIATKTAADKAALSVVRVSLFVEGERLSIRVGESVDGVLGPLRKGSKVDLTINLPARLIDLPRRQPVEPAATTPAFSRR